MMCGINGCTYEHDAPTSMGLHRRNVHGISGSSRTATGARQRRALGLSTDALVITFDDLAEAWAMGPTAALAELKRRLLDAIEHDRYVRDVRARRHIAGPKPPIRLVP